MPLSPIKVFSWNVFFLLICSNFSEQNDLNELVFDKVTSLKHTSSMNNNITKKLKLPSMILFRSTIALIENGTKFLHIYTILYIYIYIYIYLYIYLYIYIYKYKYNKYKDNYIYKDLLQAICSVTITSSSNFLRKIKSFLHQTLIP